MTQLNRFIICIGLLGASDALALPGYISLVPTDQACATCHVDRRGGGVRNAFGAQYESFGFFDRRWPTLCTLDADADGYTNGEELGDPDCEWRLLTPPPGALSNPSDPTSLPRPEPSDDDDGGSSPLPGSQTNAIPGIPANDGSDDDDGDDNSGQDADEGEEPMGSAAIPPADNMNDDPQTDIDSSNSDDDSPIVDSDAVPNVNGQSQLTPIVPDEDGDDAVAQRAPLGSRQPINTQSDLVEGEGNAASGCSTHNHTDSQTWAIPLLASFMLAIRRRRR